MIPGLTIGPEYFGSLMGGPWAIAATTNICHFNRSCHRSRSHWFYQISRSIRWISDRSSAISPVQNLNRCADTMDMVIPIK